MTTRAPYRTTFEAGHVIRPIFTGGAVALDNSGRLLATALGEDVVLTDLETGRHLGQIEGDGESVSTMTLTPSGSHVITCSRSLSMRIFALKKSLKKSETENDDTTLKPTLLRTLKPHGTPVVVLAVDRTSTLLATGGTDGSIKVWDICGGYVTHTFHGPSVLVSALHFFQVATSSTAGEEKKKRRKSKGTVDGGENEGENGDHNTTNGFRLASGSQDGKIRVWDLQKRRAVANLESHVSNVQALDYSSTQHALMSAGRDKTITWWDTQSWKVRKVVPCSEMVEAAGFAGEDGSLTYTTGSNGQLRVWDTDSGCELTKIQTLRSEEEAIVGAVARPELPFILTVQMDHTFSLYHLPSKNSLSDPPEPFRRISGTHDEIIDLRYVLPDSSMMALATNAEDIRLVSVVESKPDQTALVSSDYFGQDIGLLKGHEDIVLTLDVDWSGHWIATGAKDNTARIWRVDPSKDSYTCHATFSGHAKSVTAIAFPRTKPAEGSKSHQDPLNHPPAYLITGSEDQTVKKWDIPREPSSSKKGARSLYTRKAHEKDINAIDVNPTSTLFATASQDSTVKVWSTQEGEAQGILRGHRRGVWSLAFSPTNTPSLQGESGSVSGKGVIVTGSGDKTVKLWSLSDYTCLRTFEGHSHNVLKVVWLNIPSSSSPSDGNNAKKRMHIATAGRDGLVKVWDVNTGETETTLDNHSDQVWALAVHPRTNTLVSGSGDSTVTFWSDTSALTQEKRDEERLRHVEQEQQLQNHIHAGSYKEALELALQLNHPGRLLSLFTSVINTRAPDSGSLTGLHAVDTVLASLDDDQIFTLLLRLRDWNTNARTAPVAQRVLGAVVRTFSAERISGLRGGRGQKSVGEVLKGLRTYTERHYRRVEELVDESWVVEFTLGEMDGLVGDGNGERDGEDMVMGGL